MPTEQHSRRRRGIYLLPNLFTTAGLFFGFFAIVSAINGEFNLAALGIFVAMVMDGLDGRVARLTNTQSDFGVQFDSLSDMVCFGLAPALVMYQWALGDLAGMGDFWGKIGWIGAFTYAACAALRLARFNTQAGVAEKRYFQGLPSPAAAAGLASMVWFGASTGFDGSSAKIIALLVTVATGLLMVSNFRYYSFKEFDFRYRVPFIVLVVLVLIIAFASIHPPLVLFLAFLTYAVSGPALTLIQRRRQRAVGRRGG
ncbi:CDP-diacylglycerol--serine O-phosphatidyltransferase [Aquisalimonas sp. 2447]|uniref:CDP-diacylglycerol--serine O-phosphatidyltransferase n=1 Tax=Aquisalimonas sp. 2447 TaxID=2740807 RepID=UPI0014327A13|nr:CDP-diacylglycerol--serine O-phosphatidyltransferase [Aquisalimonas sp. 2447]QIT56037.1 CDP-diacylglycerol--serine O-phosphatidyltransferase [Aquisalimonas sp. 2447]